MEVFIEAVETGAMYENIIYDYWITGTLKDGQKIRIFDHKCYDLRNRTGQRVDCLILAFIISKYKVGRRKGNNFIIEGDFVGNVDIPEGHIVRQEYQNRKWIGFSTDNGLLYMDPREVEQIGRKETHQLSVGRFDLLGFK